MYMKPSWSILTGLLLIVAYISYIYFPEITTIYLYHILFVVIFILCILIVALVLLQRGEEGAFARDGMMNQCTSEDATMFKSTVYCGLLFIITCFVLNIIIYAKSKIL
mgnify:FL=1